MSKIIDKREIVVSYKDSEKEIKTLANFGWTVESRILLNRFGNPIPDNGEVSEDDKIEKCSYKINLVRVVDEESLMTLNQLQHKYDSIRYVDSSFGGKRITGSVFLSAISLPCLMIFLLTVGRDISSFIYLIIALLFGIPIIFIFMTGISRVVIAKETNLQIKREKQEIAEQARKYL